MHVTASVTTVFTVYMCVERMSDAHLHTTTCQTLAENDEAQARAAGDDTTRECNGVLFSLGLVDCFDCPVRGDGEPMLGVAADASAHRIPSLWSHTLESLRVHDTVAVYAVRRVKVWSTYKELRKLAQCALTSVVSKRFP
jgi:hypothetical protein